MAIYPWTSGAVVSTPGQLGPTGNAVTGWYLVGWDGTPGVLPRANALYFLADGSAAPDYTESTLLARGGVLVPEPEASRILHTLSSRGLLIGRPGTQWAGMRVTSDMGPLVQSSAPIPASELVGGGIVNPTTGAASATGQTWNWAGNSWAPTTTGGSPMNGFANGFSDPALLSWLFDLMNDQQEAMVFSQFIFAISGNYTPAAPASGSALAVYYTAWGAAATQADAVALTDGQAFQVAATTISKAWLTYLSQSRWLKKQNATFKAMLSGNMMAMMFAMMSQFATIGASALGI